jgi:hypothetical protein
MLTPSSGRVRQMPPSCFKQDTADSQETGSVDEAASRNSALQLECDGMPDEESRVEVATVESVFGAAASSWNRINQEMQKSLLEKVLDSAEQEFKELQRQLGQRAEKDKNNKATTTLDELRAQYEDVKDQFEQYEKAKARRVHQVRRFETR